MRWGKQDIRDAERLLLSLGFSPTAITDDCHRPWLRGTTGVELHFDVENPLAFDFGIDEAWTNAELSNFAGEPAWKFADRDEILFLALHGVRHQFDRWSLVLDVALAMERHVSSNSAELLRDFTSPSLRSVLDLGTGLAHKLRPDSSKPALVLNPHISRLGDRVWTRLLNEPPVTSDWESQHRFYLELESSFAGRLMTRLRHARILLRRLIPPDYEFARLFGCKRRWQVWLLRPVRLVLARLVIQFKRIGQSFQVLPLELLNKSGQVRQIKVQRVEKVD